ncbi:MAG: TonB-dependent receptor, partial [Bradyrhizobiaceae bacterium]
MSKMMTILGTFLLLAVLMSAPQRLLAQGVTTAAIAGKITSAAGEALPGVNVVATHEPSGTKYGAISREDGEYTLPNLRTGGPYTVSASVVGYQRQSVNQIFLKLSQTLDLNFRLKEEAVQAAEVVVTGERSSVFSSTHTGATTNVTRAQIDNLPTISRNFQDYYKLSPYVSSTNGNVLGRNSKYNNIQIDGTNFNDLFGLGSTGAPAGQSNVTPISLDAIEEFQMVVSPYDVRQSGFTGAGINAITRSGTNAYNGSAFYYGRNEDLAGKSPNAAKQKLSDFTDWQLGARVGGPIIQDKLFFFVNGEVTRWKQPFTRTYGNQTIGTNAYTVPIDSLNLLNSTIKSRYGYDVGSWTDLAPFRESDKAFVRFDYNLSENHKLTARWNYLRSSETNSPSRGRSATDIYADNAQYKLDDETHSIALQLTSVFAQNMSNELILGYVDQMDEPVYYGSAFPTIYINTSNQSAADKRTQKLVLGAEEFRHHNLLGQKYFEITDNFSYYLPGHTLTFGLKMDFLSFRNLFISDAFGAYTYNSIAAFLNDQRAASYSFRYSATADPLQEANWGARQYGFYAQDEWSVTPALKLTAGVRVDIPTYPDHASYNKAIDSTFGYRTDEPPKTTLSWSPRVGFNWSIDEDRTMQLRGGIGIFYGRFPYVWVSNQYSNTGVDFYTVTTVPNNFIADPNGQPKLPPTSTTAEVNLTDPNFVAPSVWRWNLGFDYKLPYDLVATVEGIFSFTQNDVYYQNINLAGTQANSGLTAGGKLAGENREVWGTWSASSRRYTTIWVNNQFSPGVFYVTNTDKGSNSNIVLQIQRVAAEGLIGSLSYTWGMAKDINSGNSTTASSGWRFNPTPGNPNAPQLTYSQWDRTHRILGILSYRYDWTGNGLATTIGVSYNGQSGRPFSWMVDGDINGDGRSDNDLAYIPKDANDVVLVNSSGAVLPTSDAAYTQLMNFINSDKYLSDAKGKIIERSGAREPWSHTIDLRLAQEVPTFDGQKIEITFDILNVMNLLNSDWGWVKTVGTNQTVNLLQFHSIENTAGSPNIGKPRYRWLGMSDPFIPDNILSRWQMQIGLRYTF